MVDKVAIRVAARRIIALANSMAGNKTLRHDLVVEAAAIITLCGPEPKRKSCPQPPRN